MFDGEHDWVLDVFTWLITARHVAPYCTMRIVNIQHSTAQHPVGKDDILTVRAPTLKLTLLVVALLLLAPGEGLASSFRRRFSRTSSSTLVGRRGGG